MTYPKILSRGQTIEIRSERPDLVAINRWWYYALLLMMTLDVIGEVGRFAARLVGAS